MDIIKPEERKVYRKILSEMEDQKKTREEYRDMFCIKFNNGIELKNDIKNGRVVLINDHDEFEINSLLPEGINFRFSKHMQRYRKELKAVVYPAVLNEIDLFGLLHEIGHAWYFYNGGKEEDFILSERNSWAWALKQMRKLKKLGFIDSKITDNDFMVSAKACLYSYARLGKSFGDSNYVNFLKKEIEKKDLKLIKDDKKSDYD